MNQTQIEEFKYMIENEYRYRLYIDDLPSATMEREEETGEFYPDYDDGIPVGVYI